MIRRPPRSTLSSSSAASDVYKRQPRTKCSCSFGDKKRANISLRKLKKAAAAVAAAATPKRAYVKRKGSFQARKTTAQGGLKAMVGALRSSVCHDSNVSTTSSTDSSSSPSTSDSGSCVDYNSVTPPEYVDAASSSVSSVDWSCSSSSIWELSLIHISEPTRLLSISYAVFCLKKKKTIL
eukprot:TRINITY_DN4198_c0_g1_i1.p1 TRINITY_DN4198_c0_g1~~TRINITY_DN4198_c0_g1_i1.p1  ORF type:complete len:180 (-),score=34.01 TRINITY_DN4198_c0_g1_i1:92-631(-)